MAGLLGPNYKPPWRELIGGKYLDAIYKQSWKEQMSLLLTEVRIFGITVFGDGATIKNVALMNVLAAGVNNLFALLDIADCTHHLARGGRRMRDILPTLSCLSSSRWSWSLTSTTRSARDC